jgi:hypothetical protein
MHLRSLSLGLVLAGVAITAPAHHGWSSYDNTKPVTLSGTIKHSGYEHPHGFVQLQTKDTLWQVILAPPYRMENRGLPRELLNAGNAATVVGYPHKSEPNELRAERITLGDKTVELR